MFTIYHKSTGEILRTSLTQNPGPGESAIPGEYSPQTHYVKRGQAIEIPPSPIPGHVFDYLIERWTEVVGADTRAILAKRAKLLSDSDWTQIPDVPLPSRQAWAQYRQALRDITGQPGYPMRIVWPEPPQDDAFVVGTM